MPTFTKIAWETLLEPTVRDSSSNPFNSKQIFPKSSSVIDSCDEEGEQEKKTTTTTTTRAPTPNHIYVSSPALYITPPLAPIPDSSDDPASPSPYVVNHKRRRGREVVRSGDGGEKRDSDGDGGEVVVEEEVVDENFFGAEVGGGGGDRNGAPAAVEEELGYFDPRSDAVSVASSNEVDELGKQVECQSFVSNQGEFFDADEDFSSDGSTSKFSSSYGPRIESELHATRLSLLEEIERRKIAERSVDQMCSQWQRLASLVSQTGLTIPTPSTAGGMQPDISSLEQCCQELAVARFVAEAIGSGQARAEAEIAAEAIIESKDHEISRLRDKLQYYEAVNHEMSQRNQEVMEAARRQRQRKRNQLKWIWGCVGLSVVIGTSVIAYSYLPQTSKQHHTLPSSGDSSDASCITTSESAFQL